MKIVPQSISEEEPIDGRAILKKIEKAGRTCYKTEDKITDTSAEPFVRMLMTRKHFSVLEHASVSIRVVCDRGVSHEIVRHRIASYSQESTRYCCYAKDKFNHEIQVIIPKAIQESDMETKALWEEAVMVAEDCYLGLLNNGISPQIARSVLPTCLKTELVMTMNLREWRHFFELRTAPEAHPEMRQVAIWMLRLLQAKIPVVFEDIKIQEGICDAL